MFKTYRETEFQKPFLSFPLLPLQRVLTYETTTQKYCTFRGIRLRCRSPIYFQHFTGLIIAWLLLIQLTVVSILCAALIFAGAILIYNMNEITAYIKYMDAVNDTDAANDVDAVYDIDDKWEDTDTSFVVALCISKIHFFLIL